MKRDGKHYDPTQPSFPTAIMLGHLHGTIPFPTPLHRAWHHLRPNLLDWLPEYSLLRSLPGDAAAGVTIGVLLVPQGLAEAGTVLAAGLAEATHRMALLDEAGHPVASGEAGELVLSGPLLALGEWQGGRLVPGRLVPEPGRPGWRRFHTGDLLRVQPDGLLRVVGRADRQVKINGVRVEPAEVEAVLLAEPGVTDATLVALARPTGTVLVGFVVAPGLEEAVLFAALRRRLAAALPAAFRPSRLHLLPVLPRMSAGGKLDRQALERLAAE
jgi:acyl-coenzyme A synthetase/AMP-(fatty) acid ligase